MSILNISNIHQPLKLFYNSNASYSVALQAPNNLSSNYTLTLPSNITNEKKALQTDGNGILTWGSGGITNNIIEGDLTIGNDDNDILTIASKLNIPKGETGQVLIKQSDNSIKFEMPNPNNEYYQIKGKTQYFFIQQGWPSTASQTKWKWDKDTSSSILRSSTALLTWISDEEFKFNKTGIYRISVRHYMVAENQGHLRGMSCKIADSSHNIILSFSQHFRSFVTSDHDLEIFNSRIIEITSTTTAYSWRAGTGNNWGTGVHHKQSNTYFIVELIKET